MVLNTLLATKKDNIIRLQCIILPEVSWSYKIFWWWWKNMSFITEDDNVFLKYNEIWNKMQMTLNIKFHIQPIYNEKYIKTKVNTFSDAISTVFF